MVTQKRTPVSPEDIPPGTSAPALCAGCGRPLGIGRFGTSGVPGWYHQACLPTAMQGAQLAAVYEAGKREGMEEAARLAEGVKSFDDNLQKSAGCLTTGQAIAAAIRAKLEER